MIFVIHIWISVLIIIFPIPDTKKYSNSNVLLTSPTPRIDSVTPLMIPRLAMIKPLLGFQTSQNHSKSVFTLCFHIVSSRRFQIMAAHVDPKLLIGLFWILRKRVHSVYQNNRKQDWNKSRTPQLYVGIFTLFQFPLFISMKPFSCPCWPVR